MEKTAWALCVIANRCGQGRRALRPSDLLKKPGKKKERRTADERRSEYEELKKKFER